MTSPSETEHLSRLPFHIPPAEAIALAVLVLEMVDEGWRQKRLDISSRVYRARRDLWSAVERGGGFTTVFRDAFARRR